MDRSDCGDDTDLGARVGGKLGDLTETAHCELDDAELGVLLEPTQRQRDAELVVEAAFGGDGAPLALADRGE